MKPNLISKSLICLYTISICGNPDEKKPKDLGDDYSLRGKKTKSNFLETVSSPVIITEIFKVAIEQTLAQEQM